MSLENNKFLFGAVFIFSAAVVFAGVLIWHDTYSAAILEKGSSMAVSSPTPTRTRPAGVPDPSTTYPYQLGAVAPIGGHVQSTTASSIVLAVPGSGLHGAPATTTMTVAINSSTEIYKEGAPKPDAAYQQEMAAFLNSVQYNTTPGAVYLAPDPNQHIASKLSDISVGTFVLVFPRSKPSNSTIDALSIQL